MANRLLHPSMSMNRGVVTLSMRLRILGNTTPANGTFTVVAGDGVSTFTRSGTGQYTITLADKYVSLLSAHFQVLCAAAIDLMPQIRTEDVAGAKTIVFEMQAAATATDTANTVVQDVLVTLRLKNTTVTR